MLVRPGAVASWSPAQTATYQYCQIAREEYDALYDASNLSSNGTPHNRKGSSRVKGNFHARFLGGRGRVNRLRLPGASFTRRGIGQDRKIRNKNPTMKGRHINKRALIGLLCLCQTAHLPGQNLLINGSFESGNTGFTSDYTHAPGNISPQGTYDVVRNPRDSHALGASHKRHGVHARRKWSSGNKSRSVEAISRRHDEHAV